MSIKDVRKLLEEGLKASHRHEETLAFMDLKKVVEQALAELAKPKCKACGGSKEVWDTQEFAGREVGDKVPCPDCKPELSEFTKLARMCIPPKEAFDNIPITDLSERPSTLESVVHTACDFIACQQAEMGRLKEIFNDYGHHLHGCNAEYDNTRTCTCGFDKALKESK